MKENLSAFIDGELDTAESLRMISRIDKETELRGQWERYHTYGSALRDELTPTLSADFSERVSEVLMQEPVQFAPAALSAGRRIRGPLAGIAVAASLVGIAILLQKPSLEITPVEQTISTAKVPAPLSVPVNTVADSSNENNQLIVANSKNENIREKINRLLVEHNEYNPVGDMTGMLPYSRFVGYNPRVDNPE